MLMFLECGFSRELDVGDNGTISSPGYVNDGFLNDSYVDNEQCIWNLRLRTLQDASISLRFLDLSIERHGECRWDYVRINAGETPNTSRTDTDITYRIHNQK